MKLTVVEERKYDFIGREGEKVIGYSYGAFCDDGSSITFTSDRVVPTVQAYKFDPSKALELDVRPRIWGGKVKFRLSQ